MGTTNIEKALTVLGGIERRDLHLTTKYINPENYVEHNPDASDGVNGSSLQINQLG